MYAAEIMTKEVVTVRPNTTVGEIADLLLDHKISAVSVIDDDRHIVGIVSEGDLLGHPPSGSPHAWWLRLFCESVVSLEEIATARHRKAHDVMTKPAVTVVDHTPGRCARHTDAPSKAKARAGPAGQRGRWHCQPYRSARSIDAARQCGRRITLP